MDFAAPLTDKQNKSDTITKIRTQLTQASLPADFKERLEEQMGRVETIIASTGYRPELDRDLEYIRFVSELPFARSSQDILDLHRAAEILNRNHYGLVTVKDRVLEYLSMLILNTHQGTRLKASVLAFVGLAGTGKTSLAYSIAESLGRQLIRLPFGGLGSVKELRGESRIRLEAEPGRLIKSIHATGYNNPVVLLDEIDRISEDARADVMGVLVELLDPEQNFAFMDYYIDYPFDLSKVLFIATANNTTNIATAVLDRLEVIEMPSYTDEEKITIGRQYILPKITKEAGVPQQMIVIDDNLWPDIVRPLGFDSGIRSLKRTIEGIVRKVAREMVEGRQGPFRITAQNMAQYLGA